MIFDWKTQRWTLVASVEGQIGACGNRDYPGIYVRTSEKEVFSFIRSFLTKKNEAAPVASANATSGYGYYGYAYAPFAYAATPIDPGYGVCELKFKFNVCVGYISA